MMLGILVESGDGEGGQDSAYESSLRHCMSYRVPVKRLRFVRPGLPRPRGRRYRAEAEITYTGATLPDDVCESLMTALAAAMGPEASGLSWSVSSDPYSRLMMSVTLIADRPLAAITRLDGALDDSLMATGLSGEFDVTGRVLQVAPVDQAWRVPVRDGDRQG